MIGRSIPPAPEPPSPSLGAAVAGAAPMTARGPQAPLAQVAFSVVDLAATERWFREGLGFRPAGGSRRRMRGPLASVGAGPASRRLDVLVDGGPQRVLPARAVPVRAAAGAADGARRPAVRHRLRAHRRLGGRLRPDADTAGAPGLTAAQRPPRAPPGRVARACAIPTACTSRSWRTTRSRAPARPEQIGVPRRGALGHPLGPRPRPVRGLLLARARPGALRCRAASTPSTRRCGGWPAPRRAAACSPPAACSSSSSSTSIRSGGRARRTTGSRTRAS